MTVKEYNEWHREKYNPTLAFVYCINHAMDKAGDNAIHQMECIGWGDKIKQTLIEALKALEDKKTRRSHKIVSSLKCGRRYDQITKGEEVMKWHTGSK